MWPTVSSHRDDCTRHDLDGVGVQYAIICRCIYASHSQRCVLEQQFLGLVQRLDVRQGSNQWPTTIDLTSNLHVAADHPWRHLAAAVDNLCLADTVDHMVAIVTTVCVIDGGLQQLNLVSWLLLNASSHLFWDLGIRPLALDSLTLHTHTAVNVINLTICTLFVAHQEQWHRDEVDGVHIVTRLNHHASCTHSQVQQEFTNGNVKVRLLQHRKHLVRVLVKDGLCLSLALKWNLATSF